MIENREERIQRERPVLPVRSIERRNKLEREHSPKHDRNEKDVDADEETVIGKDAIGFRSTDPELNVLSMKGSIR